MTRRHCLFLPIVLLLVVPVRGQDDLGPLAPLVCRSLVRELDESGAVPGRWVEALFEGHPGSRARAAVQRMIDMPPPERPARSLTMWST